MLSPTSSATSLPSGEISTTTAAPDDGLILRIETYGSDSCTPGVSRSQDLAQPPLVYLVDGAFYLSNSILSGDPTLVVEDTAMLALAKELTETLQTSPFKLSTPGLGSGHPLWWRIEFRVGATISVGCAYHLAFDEAPKLVSPESAEAVRLAEELLTGLGYGQGGAFWGRPDSVALDDKSPIVLIPGFVPQPGAEGTPLPNGVVIGSSRCISLDAAQQRDFLETLAQVGSSRWTDGEVTTDFLVRRLLPYESCETIIHRFDTLLQEYIEDAGS